MYLKINFDSPYMLTDIRESIVKFDISASICHKYERTVLIKILSAIATAPTI